MPRVNSGIKKKILVLFLSFGIVVWFENPGDSIGIPK